MIPIILLLCAGAQEPAEITEAPEVILTDDIGLSDVWIEALTPEELIAVAIVNDTIDRLAQEGRLKGEGVPWLAWGREFLKGVFGLFTLIIIMRTRRPQFDAAGIVDRLDRQLRPYLRPAQQKQALARLQDERTAQRLKIASLKADNASLHRVIRTLKAPKPSTLPGLEDPAARRAGVERQGIEALRRR